MRVLIDFFKLFKGNGVTGCAEAALVHAAQLASMRPSVVPGAVVARVADGSVGDCRQFVRV